MSHLMSNNIGHGKIAGCAKARLQIIIERQVDINFGIQWAIERPCSRRSITTSGLTRSRKQNQHRLLVVAALLEKYFIPDILCILEDDGHKLSFLIRLLRILFLVSFWILSV